MLLFVGFLFLDTTL